MSDLKLWIVQMYIDEILRHTFPVWEKEKPSYVTGSVKHELDRCNFPWGIYNGRVEILGPWDLPDTKSSEIRPYFAQFLKREMMSLVEARDISNERFPDPFVSRNWNRIQYIKKLRELNPNRWSVQPGVSLWRFQILTQKEIELLYQERDRLNEACPIIYPEEV